LIASAVYFAGVCAIGLSCLVVFFCRQYIKYFPKPLVWFFVVEACVLVFDLLMHTPIAPAKNLWFMLVMSTHALIPLMTVIVVNSLASAEKDKSLGFKLILGLSASCILLGFYRIPYIEFHSEWALYRSIPAFLNQFYYPTLIVNTIAYLTLSILALLKVWRAIPTLPNDADRRHLVQILFWSLAVGLMINIGRIAHCNVDGAVGFTNLALSVLDVFVSCAFWLAILVAILRMTLQDIRVDDQGALSSSVSKYGKHSVSKEDSERIQHKLNQALENQELVTDNNLTLAKLSTHIGEKHHAVSQVINRDLSTSFFELIYERRVELACSIMQTNPDSAIVDIYTSVGFNSKTTFYKAFAKRKAQTPAEFKKQVAKA
jgi:AraC-like DNA-binding protein